MAYNLYKINDEIKKQINELALEILRIINDNPGIKVSKIFEE